MTGAELMDKNEDDTANACSKSKDSSEQSNKIPHGKKGEKVNSVKGCLEMRKPTEELSDKRENIEDQITK